MVTKFGMVLARADFENDYHYRLDFDFDFHYRFHLVRVKISDRDLGIIGKFTK